MMLTLGTLLNRVAAEPNPEQSFAFFMPTAKGPCRFGVYNSLHKMTLERLGMAERVRVISPEDTDYFAGMTADFTARLWLGFVAGGGVVLDGGDAVEVDVSVSRCPLRGDVGGPDRHQLSALELVGAATGGQHVDRVRGDAQRGAPGQCRGALPDVDGQHGDPLRVDAVLRVLRQHPCHADLAIWDWGCVQRLGRRPAGDARCWRASR